MNSFTVHIKPQFVRLTKMTALFPDGEEHRLHEVQKRMKMEYDQLSEFVIITAPTGTGKSYAFPFPVLEAKKKGGLYDDGLRGCIVLPTNALIDELTENFVKTYPGLAINRLTGEELNARLAKGFQRWETALDICKSSDLVITNPDIINYAMHGGYHRFRSDHKTGGREFVNFLEKFDYFIFDEYHLYDETQIANLLTLINLRKFFLRNKKVRWFFVSATPEEGLKNILEQEGYEFEEIIELITDDPSEARPIHGRLEVEFVECNDLSKIIAKKSGELLEEREAGRRSLVIADQLRDVHLLAAEWRNDHAEMKVYESTGYRPKDENSKKELAIADLILATNKAEVGVNYNVEYCIMQTGKYFRNFVQRFGRVSRGDLEGKVVVAVNNFSTFNRLRASFAGHAELSYYDFLNLARPHFQKKEFYTEIIPFLVGEYIWCIENNIATTQEFNTGKYLRRRMGEEEFFRGKVYARYKYMDDVDNLILEGMKHFLGEGSVSKWRWKQVMNRIKAFPTVEKWANWWQTYLETYFTFRDASKVVPIIDASRGNQEVEYSLDWILQHKELIHIERDKDGNPDKYIVGNLKERNKDIQYIVSTFPPGDMSNKLMKWKEQFELDKVFLRALERTIKKSEKGVDWKDEWQVRLCKKLVPLAATFSMKRLRIDDIYSDDYIL